MILGYFKGTQHKVTLKLNNETPNSIAFHTLLPNPLLHTNSSPLQLIKSIQNANSATQ